MAEKSSETDKASSKEVASPSSSNPISERIEAHRRAQQDSNNHMAKVFDILESAKKNLKELERQRLTQMEGLKNLRARLFQENEALRVTAAELSRRSAKVDTTIVLPETSKTLTRKPQSVVIAPTVSTSSYPRWIPSSKSVTIGKTPSKSLSLVTSIAKTPSKSLSLASSMAKIPSKSLILTASETPPPRTSSSRSLYKRKPQRHNKRSKHRMLTSNQDNVSGISGESEQSTTAKNLKQRFLSNFKY